MARTSSDIGAGKVLIEKDQYNNLRSDVFTRCLRGTAAARPAAADEGLLYWAHDTKELSRDTGSAWETISGEVPTGLIAMWHGTIASIPGGWVICDGNNSTPNLLDRFVQSVPTIGTDPGGTGGATAKTTSGHVHGVTLATQAPAYTAGAAVYADADGAVDTASQTDSITDIRPKYYQIAFIMKT